MEFEFIDSRQEHEEHEAGVQNEYQNAFQLSKMTTEIKNDSAAIERLRKEGSYVLVVEVDVCCKFTDALLGRAIHLVAHATTREELVARMHGIPESSEEYILNPITGGTR